MSAIFLKSGLTFVCLDFHELQEMQELVMGAWLENRNGFSSLMLQRKDVKSFIS
jgi:hypothetical protein